MIARTSRPPPDRARQRFALLVDSLDDEHELSVVHGSLAAARELDARLVVVAGGPVDTPDERLRAGNFVFDLVGRDNALGILVLSSALGNAIGPERLAEWLTRYADAPLCCMGVPIPGRVSVRVDNATGIAEAVDHLHTVHGKQNIGFIRGPAQSDEAEVRYAAYRDALSRHGIDPDPRWVAKVTIIVRAAAKPSAPSSINGESACTLWTPWFAPTTTWPSARSTSWVGGASTSPSRLR